MLSVGMVFWILMLVWVVFGGYRWRAAPATAPFGELFAWVLFFLIGWKVFGWPIHG